MPIGNVNSTERGSGARFNDGKPDLSLIPPRLLYVKGRTHLDLADALHDLMFAGDDSALTHWHNMMMREHVADCAHVFEYGKRKYAAWNWAKGMAWSIPVACALRHAHALWVEEQENDAESGLSHIGHILCNTTMILHFTRNYPDLNDLPHKVLNANANN